MMTRERRIFVQEPRAGAVFVTVLRVLATIIAGPMLLVGIAWVLQGLNILPGSFMTGQIIWAVYGAPLALVGVALVWWVNTVRR